MIKLISKVEALYLARMAGVAFTFRGLDEYQARCPSPELFMTTEGAKVMLASGSYGIFGYAYDGSDIRNVMKNLARATLNPVAIYDEATGYVHEVSPDTLCVPVKGALSLTNLFGLPDGSSFDDDRFKVMTVYEWSTRLPDQSAYVVNRAQVFKEGMVYWTPAYVADPSEV